MSVLNLHADDDDRSGLDTRSSPSVKIFCVGASNLGKINTYLHRLVFKKELRVVDFCKSGWRLDERATRTMVGQLEEAQISLQDVVVFDPFCNQVWYDLAGPPVITRSDAGGRPTYHFVDPVIIDNKRRDKIVNNAKQIIETVPKGAKIILMMPVPRYLSAGCCDNQEHMRGREKLAEIQFGRINSYMERFGHLARSLGHSVRVLSYSQLSKLSISDPGNVAFFKSFLSKDNIHLDYNGVEIYARCLDTMITDWIAGKGSKRQEKRKALRNNSDLRAKLSKRSDKVECSHGSDSQECKSDKASTQGSSEYGSEIIIKGKSLTVTIKQKE